MVTNATYGLDCPASGTGTDLLSLMKEGGGHGTQVAGIIGAQATTGEGIAGMAWNSDILAIKACYCSLPDPEKPVVDMSVRNRENPVIKAAVLPAWLPTPSMRLGASMPASST